MRCIFCKSLGVNKNRAGTEFCTACCYYVTRKGNQGRIPGHPKFDELGYKIKPAHPDYLIKYKPKKRETWARNDT